MRHYRSLLARWTLGALVSIFADDGARNDTTDRFLYRFRKPRD